MWRAACAFPEHSQRKYSGIVFVCQFVLIETVWDFTSIREHNEQLLPFKHEKIALPERTDCKCFSASMTQPNA